MIIDDSKLTLETISEKLELIAKWFDDVYPTKFKSSSTEVQDFLRGLSAEMSISMSMLVSNQWKELYFRVQVATGMENDPECQYTTLSQTEPVVQMIYPQGFHDITIPLKVSIQWKLDEHDKAAGFSPLIDSGYLFIMPNVECNDVFMSGIVHIPFPAGGEKDQPEPEWHTLYDLERNELIESITIEK